MKTAREAKEEARKKEQGIAEKLGVNPNEVPRPSDNPVTTGPEGQAPPTPPAKASEPAPEPASPEKPPEGAAPTAEPQKEPESPPLVLPPAADPVPGAAAPAAEPPHPPGDPAPEPDYKALYAAEQATNKKLGEDNASIRKHWNRETSEKQRLALDNQILRIGAAPDQRMQAPPTVPPPVAAQPPPVAPPPAPPQPPPVAPVSTEHLDAEEKKAIQAFTEQYGEELGPQIADLARIQAEKIVAKRLGGAVEEIHQRIEPLIQSVQHDLTANAQAAEQAQSDRAVETIAKMHPDWHGIVNSEQFTIWVAQHPFAPQISIGLYPEDTNLGFTADAIVSLLNDFKAQDPRYVAERERLAEAEGRSAAAAGVDIGKVPLPGPIVDSYGQGQPMLQSEFVRLGKEYANNKVELKKLVAAQKVAQENGSFIYDLKPRAQPPPQPGV